MKYLACSFMDGLAWLSIVFVAVFGLEQFKCMIGAPAPFFIPLHFILGAMFLWVCWVYARRLLNKTDFL